MRMLVRCAAPMVLLGQRNHNDTVNVIILLTVQALNFVGLKDIPEQLKGAADDTFGIHDAVGKQNHIQ